jgi:hypothetical protein
MMAKKPKTLSDVEVNGPITDFRLLVDSIRNAKPQPPRVLISWAAHEELHARPDCPDCGEPREALGGMVYCPNLHVWTKHGGLVDCRMDG